ncbi:MAG: ECF-type sigma factor [Vicinamibacteria bacterium]
MDASISSLIASAEEGDRSAADALFAALYSELHRLARRQLARSAADMTLGTTTLLHEAYLEMAGRESAVFPDRGRFMAYAARVMRGLIIDYVRSRRAQKRGGEFTLVALAAEVSDPSADDEELTRISDALDELAAVEPLLAQVVDLKFFCGFSLAEIAGMRGPVGGGSRGRHRRSERAAGRISLLVPEGTSRDPIRGGTFRSSRCRRRKGPQPRSGSGRPRDFISRPRPRLSRARPRSSGAGKSTRCPRRLRIRGPAPRTLPGAGSLRHAPSPRARPVLDHPRKPIGPTVVFLLAFPI